MMHILNLIFSEYAIVALDVWATQFLTIPRTMFGIQPRRGCTESLACHLHASHDVHTHCDTCVSWNSCTLFLGLSALGLRRPFCKHYFTSDSDWAQANCLYFICRHEFAIRHLQRGFIVSWSQVFAALTIVSSHQRMPCFLTGWAGMSIWLSRTAQSF